MLTATTLPDGVSVAKASATGTITDTDTLDGGGDRGQSDRDRGPVGNVYGDADGEPRAPRKWWSTTRWWVPPRRAWTYTAPSGKLTIGASDTSGEIAIKTREDDVLDRGETLELRLYRGDHGWHRDREHDGHRRDDDHGPWARCRCRFMGLNWWKKAIHRLTVDKSSVEEGESASFVVALSGPVEKTVEVSYATSDGTGNGAAAAGTDYTAADVTLTFASKETSKTVGGGRLPWTPSTRRTRPSP